MRSSIICSALVLTLAWLMPSTAAADTDQELAKQHFKLGREMFKRADYSGAIEQFNRAYKHSKKPALLYNIARAQESLGRHEEAIKIYERFLATNPGDAKQIRTRIDNLKRLVEQKHKDASPKPGPEQTPTPTPTPEPAPEPAPEPREDDGEAASSSGGPGKLLGWIGVGAGGALVVTGLVLGGLASAKATEMEDGHRDGQRYADLQPTEDAGEALQAGQIATLVAGGVVAAAGAVLLYMHYGRQESSDSQEPDDRAAWLLPAAGPRGGMLCGGFSF